MHYDDFSLMPQHLLTRRGDHPLLASCDRVLHAGDLFILATCSFAEWLLRHSNFALAVSSPLSCVAQKVDRTETFRTWVDAQYLDEKNWLRQRGNAVVAVRVL